MFGWLKRKAEISIAKAQKADIDRFLAGLRAADSDLGAKPNGDGIEIRHVHETWLPSEVVAADAFDF